MRMAPPKNRLQRRKFAISVKECASRSASKIRTIQVPGNYYSLLLIDTNNDLSGVSNYQRFCYFQFKTDEMMPPMTTTTLWKSTHTHTVTVEQRTGKQPIGGRRCTYTSAYSYSKYIYIYRKFSMRKGHICCSFSNFSPSCLSLSLSLLGFSTIFFVFFNLSLLHVYIAYATGAYTTPNMPLFGILLTTQAETK